MPLFFLVDARGVEPLSENLSIQLSTSVAHLLIFLTRSPVGRLSRKAVIYCMTATMTYSPFTFTADLMPGVSRDTLTRDRHALCAYAAANSVLLAFNFKLELF